MASIEAIAPNYRRAQQRWPAAPTLSNCYSALSGCVEGSPHGMVEQIKSFIESVCLTIMGELREPMPSATPSTTDLLVSALNGLGLRNTRGATKLDKVLSGFNRLADALTEMRNETGAVAHGKDGFLEPVSADHARAFLHVGDAILGVLLNAFEGKQPDLIGTREPYESFPHLNERIDGAISIDVRIDDDRDRPVVVFSVATGPRAEAIELRIEASRLLYGVDREAYIEVLKTASVAVEIEEEEEQSKNFAEANQQGAGEWPVLEPIKPTVALVTSYQGALGVIRLPLEGFLVAEGVQAAAPDSEGSGLVDSLLATVEKNMGLDWKDREPIQARLKVACKRVLVRFGTTLEKSDAVADRLVTWLRVQAPDIELPSVLGPVGASP